MYNFNGLLHTSRTCLIVGLIGVIPISIYFFTKKKTDLKAEKENNKRKAEKLRKKSKRIKIEIVIIFCVSLVLLSRSCFYAYKAHNPTVVYRDCYYLYTNYSWRRNDEYVFSVDKDTEKLWLYMPNKMEIYPDKFSKDTLYRVYYEKSTSYIVKIEEIDE